MKELFAGWSFAYRRLRAGWRFMVIAAVGVIAAAALLATAPIYTNAMSDLGLTFRLDRDLETAEARLVSMGVDQLLIGDPADRARREAIDRVTEARVGWFAGERLIEERSERFTITFPAFADQEPPRPVLPPEDATEPFRQPWGSFLFWLSEFEEYVEVVEGRLPGPASNGAEVVVPAGFGDRHVALGDEILIEGPAYDDCVDVPPSEDPATFVDEQRCVPSLAAITTATATIVGFVRPLDAADPRWTIFQGEWDAPELPFLPRLDELTADDELFESRALRGDGSMPLLTTHEQYFEAFAQRLPELQSRHQVGFLLESDAIGLDDVPFAIESLGGWTDDLRRGLNLPVLPRLGPLRSLERFENLRSFSQIPLLIILLQVVGIVLYYVVIVMAMLLDRQAEEIGVYRSRGATTTQLLGLYLVEGLILAVPAFLLGPWLAAGMVSLLGLTPTFEPATGGSLLAVEVTAEAYLLGAGGAAIALLAILLPAYVFARRGIIDVKREQARPAARGVVQRYYLDLAVVVLAALLLWQLQQRGSVFDPGTVGGWSSDPMLLLSPLVLTLAVALVVLRLYPPLLRVVVRILLALRGTAVAIGLRRAGRAPAAYARLVLLLIMAVSVGTFAASYGPTVDRSLEERARYDAATGMRAPLRLEREPSGAALGEVRAHPAIADAQVVHRGTVDAPGGRSVAVLALDVPRSRQMLWSREDFSERPIDDALASLGGRLAGGGIELPPDTVALEIALQSDNIDRPFIRARVRDDTGYYHGRSVELPEERESEGGWLVARSLELPPGREYTFVGLLITDRAGQNLRQGGMLRLDALTAVRADGSRVIIEDFEGVPNWLMFGAHQMDETFTIERGNAYSGSQVAEWVWAETVMPGRRVLGPVDPAVPLAVLADSTAAALLGSGIGGLGTVVLDGIEVPVTVREVVDFFPTLQPGNGFIVVNREHLNSIAGVVDHGSVTGPSELWLEFTPEASLAEQRDVIAWLGGRTSPVEILAAHAVHRDALLDESRANPTLRASGSGILVVAFGSVLGLSMLGFVVTLVLGARARVLEFAVLRAVGSSSREILRALVLEWGVVLLLGAGIGLVLGRQVARIMLSFLEVTEEGTRVLPPFILVTDWLTLGLGAAALVLVVAAALGIAWANSMRRADASELRLTR